MVPSGLPAALYAASVSALTEERLYAQAYAAATPGRREKTDRFRFIKDKRLSLAAELLLRHGLRMAGVEKFPAAFAYGAQEKPYLKGQNIWFNLSHSEEWVVCAVTDCEVGCDVEKMHPIDLKIAERFFFRSEFDDIAAQPTPEARNERFFSYWTLKESFMKATGLGMKLPLDAFQILRGEQISVMQSVDDRSYSFQEYEDIPGYKCALCAAGACGNVPLQIVDFREILTV